MQWLIIKPNTTLKSLGEVAGSRNLDSILSANTLRRTPNIWQAFIEKSEEIINTTQNNIDYRQKMSILNTLTSDSDIFELAALTREQDWKVLAALGTLPGMLKIPEDIVLPDSADVLGNNQSVERVIYDKAMGQLSREPHYIDPSIFNELSTVQAGHSRLVKSVDTPLHWFKLPWGKITLFSSLAGESIDFPVYPNSPSDGVRANYTTMPNMLYQYEPWQIYTDSGPRTNTYEFDMHRDMWSGDHRDGKCNELIRFCQANCYPEYKGAAVITSTCILYIAGSPLISGIITDVNVEWGGPIGLDGFWLEVKLKISITEVSQEPLNYSVVKGKRLIG